MRLPWAATGDEITQEVERGLPDAGPPPAVGSPAQVWRGNQMKSVPNRVRLALISKSHLPHLDVFFKAFPSQR